MTIRYVDGDDLTVETIIAVLYAPPNYGKSSLALSASKPILFDFDRGAHRAGNKSGKSIVPVSSWSDAGDVTREDLESFDTIILDTAGTCLDYLAEDIISGNKKAASGGTLSLNGYGILKTRFRQFLGRMKTMGKDVVMVAHVKEEQRGDDVVDRIVASGSSRDEIYQSADIMGRIHMDGERRIISFDPTANAYAKNVGLDDYVLPVPGTGNDDAMARIIKQAKININGSN